MRKCSPVPIGSCKFDVNVISVLLIKWLFSLKYVAVISIQFECFNVFGLVNILKKPHMKANQCQKTFKEFVNRFSLLNCAGYPNLSTLQHSWMFFLALFDAFNFIDLQSLILDFLFRGIYFDGSLTLSELLQFLHLSNRSRLFYSAPGTICRALFFLNSAIRSRSVVHYHTSTVHLNSSSS